MIKFGRHKGRSSAVEDSQTNAGEEAAMAPPRDVTRAELLPRDEHLLERVNTLWQFGAWEELGRIDVDALQQHPDRARVALLVGAGCLQLGQQEKGRRCVELAMEWGCGRKLIERVLVSGVYNSLGCGTAIGQHPRQALQYFENAIAIGAPGSDAKLLTQARSRHQFKQIGLQSSDEYQNLDELKVSPPVFNNLKDEPLPEPTSPTKKKKFSSDADIDDFLEDIAPFFLNRSIVYVDIGAYIGEVFTKLLATKKIKLREAHLIEPNPDSYQKLQDAVKSSGHGSCNTYHIGISNTQGTAIFKAAKSMTKRVRADISTETSSNIFETECRRLDEIANLFTDGRIHLMKLDVEGEELDVLNSAEQLLKEQRIDVLYVEVGLNRSGTQQTYFGDLDVLLQSYGYRVFKIYEQKNEWIDDSPLLRRCNAAYMSSRFESEHPYSKTLKASSSWSYGSRDLCTNY